LVNQGSGFTIPRELLFRTYAPLWKPILFFSLLLLFLKFIYSKFKDIKFIKDNIVLVTLILGIVSAFSLFFTVQTNPDFGLYQREAKYFVANGLVDFFNNWGTFSCNFNFPVIAFLRGLTYSFFGEGKFSVLGLNFLFILGITYFLYKSAEKLFSREIGLISILLFSFSPYVITQTPLLLVDLGLTFFVVLTFYLNLVVIEKKSWLISLLLGLVISLTALSKVFGLVYLLGIAAFCFVYLLAFNKRKAFKSIFIGWLTGAGLSLIYAFSKKDLFYILINKHASPEKLVKLLGPLGGIIVLATICLVLFNDKLSQINFRKLLRLLIPLFYLTLIILFFFPERPRFYLRTIIIGNSIPLAILFYSSFLIAYLKKNWKILLLIPIIFSFLFIPNTMFKYQLPNYPFIMLVSAYSLVELGKAFGDKLKTNLILIILAFSISITYFFFMPMIQKHVKNNIRNSVRYINNEKINEISLTMYPIGEWGEKFQDSIDNPTKCPHPPSLVDIVDFWTPAEVGYLTRDELFRKLQTGQDLPESVFLVYHLDVPVVEDPELIKLLEEKYNEGPMFDQTRGSGIWRIKIKVWTKNIPTPLPTPLR
jgi:hypothetical protein